MLISLEKRTKCVSSKVLDIHVPIKETNMSNLSSLPLWIKTSEYSLWHRLVFVIDLGKIIVVEIFVPIKYLNVLRKAFRISEKYFCYKLTPKIIENRTFYKRKFREFIKQDSQKWKTNRSWWRKSYNRGQKCS